MKIAPAVLLLVVCTAPVVRGQGGTEVEVYRSDVLARRTLMLELHTNYTFRGPDASATGGTPPDDRRPLSVLSFDPVCYNPATPFYQRAPVSPVVAFAVARAASATVGCDLYGDATAGQTANETLEAVAGLTRWAEVAGYVFATKAEGSAAQWAGATVRTKLQVPRAWRWPVGVAVSTEIEYERSLTSISTWTWEIRPIIDRTLGRWYVALNPTIERRLRGPGVVSGLQFLPSGKVSYDATPRITAGVEYYGAYGTFGAFAAPNDRLQQLYGAVDLHVSPKWEINIGVGFGVTPATSQLAAKLILGRAITW